MARFERMENSTDCYSIPNTYFRLKSWCNRWLSVDPENLREVTFVKRQEEGSCICLVPRSDGQYMLQLLLEDSCQDRLKPKSLRSEHVNYSSDLHSGHGWFLCRQGQLIYASQNEFESLDKHFHFSLELDEHGYVRFRSVLDNAYWTSDSRGNLLASAQKAKKWESFKLIEFYAKLPSWMSHAPVRVNLKSHTGKYLCSASSFIWAAAEAPCCCEEFLLDITFPPAAPFCDLFKECGQYAEFWSSKRHSVMNTVVSEKQTYTKRRNYLVAESKCMIRTSDGRHYLSAESDGKLSKMRHDEALGHETFFLELLSQKGQPKIGIRHCNNPELPDQLCYVSTEPSGNVILNKFRRRKWEEFGLELANGSRILIQTIHGGFVGSEVANDRTGISCFSAQLKGSHINEKTRTVCFSPSKFQEVAAVGAWRLRAHGDSFYTLVAATLPRGCGDVYLFVDARGRVLQSGEPGVHFPATASLFEIKPVTAAHFTGRDRDMSSSAGMDGAVVGFTLRTVRKVNGKQRFLTAEPNGVLLANRICISHWEIFRLIDVDATAATVSPSEFVCLPAAVNISAVVLPTLSFAARRGLAAPLVVDDQGSSVGGSGRNNIWALPNHNNLEYLKKASQVSVAAVWKGQTAPSRTPASLQHLCIHQICLQAYKEIPLVGLGNLITSMVHKDLIMENFMGIPDDLLARIELHLRARKHLEKPCKFLPSMFTPQNGSPSQNDRSGHTRSEGNSEGLYCHSCNQEGALKMDPMLNPAHHRYLEVQYHVQSEMTQQRGFLWNLISFAGVSIMSTLLLFQCFANGNKRQNSRNRR